MKKRPSSKKSSTARTSSRGIGTRTREVIRVRASRAVSKPSVTSKKTGTDSRRTSKGSSTTKYGKPGQKLSPKKHASTRSVSARTRVSRNGRMGTAVGSRSKNGKRKIARKLPLRFPKKGDISPVFAKYVDPVGDVKRVTYAQVEVDFSYEGDLEDLEESDFETEEEYERAVRKLSKKKRRIVPLKIGYYTRKSIKRLDFEDIREAAHRHKGWGQRVTLISVKGFLQRKPDKERRGVYFTKKRAKRAARATNIRETKKLKGRAHRAEVRNKASDKALAEMARRLAITEAENRALKESKHHARKRRRGTRR